MEIRCTKCGNIERIKLHKDGYEVIYGTCSHCMQWTRKFKIPAPRKLKDLRVHLIVAASLRVGESQL